MTVSLPSHVNLGNSPHSAYRRTTVVAMTHSREPPLLRTWLHRLFPAVSANPVVTQALWIHRDGTRRVDQIGRVPIETYYNSELHQIQWLPDGKQISFIYRGMLYVLPSPARDRQDLSLHCRQQT